MDDVFLTVAEVAQLLKVNAQTVRNWGDRGEIPVVRVGQRRVRIRQSDLDAFIAAGSRPRPADIPTDLDRAELAARLDRARNALEGDDDAELAEALRVLVELPQNLERPS
jgi:excisionase family DNA binding protein